MLDYEKKYLDLISGLNQCIPDVSKEYPNCNGFEKAVISMRKERWTYEQIQKKLGMPSKKSIREVLVKWAPELIDNSLKKIIEIGKWESELYNILVHTDKTHFDFEDEDWIFKIEDHKIIYIDSWGFKGMFHDLNDIMKQQILIAIKEQIDGST